MWPLESARDIVRIGRERVEWWSHGAQGLDLRRQQPLDLPAGPDADALSVALHALFEAQHGEGRRSIEVVLESAWLPAMLLPTGPTPWSTAKLHALLRHRLGQLYGGMHDPIEAWELQLDHRPGDAQAVGYGLAPLIKSAVIDAAAAAGRRLASVQPALAWGRHRLEPVIRRAADAWWVWVEQDRSLVCRLEACRISAMNVGAPVPRDGAHAQRLVEIEAHRQGTEVPQAPSLVTGWAASEQHGRDGASDAASLQAGAPA